MSTVKRSSGIEILRILLMIMVLILHINLQGGILYSIPFGSIQYFSGWLLEALCFCAVNGYAMITGYVSCESRFSYKKIIPMWLQVFFWNTLINLLFMFSGKENLNITLGSFLPVNSNAYWYFTSYFGMFFFIPFFNKLINQLDFKNYTILVSTTFILFSFYANCFAAETDLFLLNGGYSMIWLSILYFYGAYAKKFSSVLKLKKRIWALIFFISSSIPAISSCALEASISAYVGDSNYTSHMGGYMLDYNSPFLIISAFALLMIFKDIDIKSPKLNSIILFFSAGSFGVYLIHTHTLIFEQIIKDLFVSYAEFNTLIMLLCIIGTAIAAYIVLAACERLRIFLFDLLKIKENIFKAADKLTEKIMNMKLK